MIELYKIRPSDPLIDKIFSIIKTKRVCWDGEGLDYAYQTKILTKGKKTASFIMNIIDFYLMCMCNEPHNYYYFKESLDFELLTAIELYPNEFNNGYIENINKQTC
eukprot:TRINITY_DN1367_c0_g1_i3.p1 TRINITY_DN1367_c0_g1~~TRINITY_DN1367_c0_g1_i3.p1  ORF type:complete len:106 (-),score=15.84 TRINITY_DN1367_c0_g1_i3:32-349(-)